MIGLLPAAGSATRLYGLPKWALPIPDGYLLRRHVEQMLHADCSEVLVGSNPRNNDLLREFTDIHRTHIYAARNYTTMTETVLSAYGELQADEIDDHFVLFGMPDTYWQVPHVYQILAAALAAGADVAAAVFRARAGQTNGGMCRLELIDIRRRTYKITEVVDKPEITDLEWIWGALAWKPAFWQYMQPTDPHVGYALPRAIDAGLDVRAVQCEGGYYDCGTIEGYYEALTAAMHKEVV